MTLPVTNGPGLETAASDITYPVQSDTTVQRLPVQVPMYAVRVGQGMDVAVVCPIDFARADSAVSSPVVQTWSSPELVLATFKLEPLLESARALALEMFGGSATIGAEIEQNSENGSPELLFRLHVKREDRPKRLEYMSKYSTLAIIPHDAPVPVLQWAYADAS